MLILARISRVSIVLLLGLMIVLISACSHTIAPTKTEFQHGGNSISGRLMLPDTPGPHPAVLIVHGDGEGTWDSYGYYRPYIRALNDAGFAVYSWDKPGVGGSSGNWLEQSMQDRASEVIAAANMLRANPNIRSNEIGLLGFSQAGWVMPKAIAQDQSFSFMIAVSGAINWLEQSKYTTRNRLRLDGATEEEIHVALEFDQGLVDLMHAEADYSAYETYMDSAPDCCTSRMSEDRWSFVKLNVMSDARYDLKGVNVPVLAVFGDRDMNVDFGQSAEVYQAILARTPGEQTVVTLADADHMLLPSTEDRYVTSGPALTQRIISVDVFGADAFAGDAIDVVAQWVRDLDHLAPRQVSSPQSEW